NNLPGKCFLRAALGFFRAGDAIPQTMRNGQEMTQPSSNATKTTGACELEVHVVVGGEPRVSLPAAFYYYCGDPYAVRPSIGATFSGSVNWVFALSLLQ
ncbi:hypothetical protein ABT215_44585, partial [Streptomyces sp900105755]